jgi:pimeloyl-ACP methyl ester carboxylesterase
MRATTFPSLPVVSLFTGALLAVAGCGSKGATPVATPTAATALDPGEETGRCDAPDGPLATSLYLPENAPSAAVIVDVGAQPWNRWGDLPGGRAWSHYRAFAQALRAAGAATMLYDKRGTGLSEGPTADLSGRLRDSLAVEKCLRTALPGVPIVRMGHSAGSVVAARATSPEERLVLLSPVVDASQMPDVPTLLVRGGADGGASADAARLAAHPKARQVVAPDANHLLMIEEGGQTVVSPVALAAVVDFVTGS